MRRLMVGGTGIETCDPSRVKGVLLVFSALRRIEYLCQTYDFLLITLCAPLVRVASVCAAVVASW